MTRKQPVACLLVLIMFLTTALTGISSIYGAESGNRCMSRLSVSGDATSFGPGDTVTLTLSAASGNGEVYGIRGYENVITVDTTQFEVVGASSAEALKASSFINPNYRMEGTKQKIRWTCMTYQNSPVQLSGTPAVLGTIQLRVKQDADSGTAIIRQEIDGVYEEGGAWISDISAEALSLELTDGKAAYHFGLEVEGEALSSYSPGDEITVVSYVTSSAANVNIAQATTQLLFDDSVFELVSLKGAAQVLTGSSVSGGVNKATLYYETAGEGGTPRLNLASMVLRVRPEAGAATAEVRQEGMGINISPESGAASKVSGSTLALSIVPKGSCLFELTPREKQDTYKIGETVVVDLTVKTPEPMAPRMIGSEIGFREDTFEFITASAVLNGTEVNGGTRSVKWLYYNGNKEEADTLGYVATLGSITLRIRENAPVGRAVLSQLDSNLYGSEGVLYEVTAAEDFAVQVVRIKEPKVSPTDASYDKSTSQGPLEFTLDEGEFTFEGIEGMAAGTDYTTAAGMVSLTAAKLQSMPTGSSTLVFLFSGGRRIEVKLSLSESAAAKQYQLIAAANYDSMGSVTGAGSYKAGETVELTAQAKEGYRFVRWEAPQGVEIGPLTQAAVSFVMPERDLTVTALFASANTRTYETLLTAEGDKKAYRPGDQLTVAVQAKAGDGEPYGIRTIETFVEFDDAVFEITSMSGIDGAVVTAPETDEASGAAVRVYYYNGEAQETLTDPLDLATIQLTVKADAPAGSALLTQTVAGFVDARGDDLTGNVIGSGADFVIEEAPKGVTVSGYVGALPGANGGDAVTGVRNITVTFADGLTAVTDETGHFSVMAVPSGDYEVTFTGTGVVSRKETIQVRDQDLQVSSAEKMIGVLRGDYNGDNDINLSDLTEFMKTYKKNSTMEGFSPVGDYNYDNDISLEDLTLFMQHYKKDSSYYENWAY